MARSSAKLCFGDLDEHDDDETDMGGSGKAHCCVVVFSMCSPPRVAASSAAIGTKSKISTNSVPSKQGFVSTVEGEKGWEELLLGTKAK